MKKNSNTQNIPRKNVKTTLNLDKGQLVIKKSEHLFLDAPFDKNKIIQKT